MKPYKIEFRERVSLSLTEENEDSVIITGLAVSDKVNSRYMRFTDKALDMASIPSSWQGAKTLVDHEYRSFDIVGQVTAFDRASDGINFALDINPHHPSKVHIQVKRRDIDGVSVGGEAHSVTCSICEKEVRDVECDHYLGIKYEDNIAIGLINDFKLKELSLTGFPADTNAKITGFYDVAQSLNAEKKSRIEESVKKDDVDVSVKIDIDTTDLEKKLGESSERFINPKKEDKSDLKMTDDNPKKEEIIIVENETIQILESALEKFSKENAELSQYVTQKKSEEKESKIAKIMELSDMAKEKLDSFSDESLDATLLTLSKVKQPKVDNKPKGSYTRVPLISLEQADAKSKKELVRQLFGFDSPSESAVKKVQQSKKRPNYMIGEIVIGEKGEE